EGVTDGNAGLWASVNGGSGTLDFQELGRQGPLGTTAWKRYEIEIPVPPNATQLNYGVILSGRGRSWFDGLEITIDEGSDVEI
ncbi:MAG: hypothetical protein GWO20_20270, partial [Candidatus Korarchaeota archaeon]|nr:hypothetical protein [Candidatus Korarchaeota archaeon]